MDDVDVLQCRSSNNTDHVDDFSDLTTDNCAKCDTVGHIVKMPLH